MDISLAYSPCPNDTFMFGGVALKKLSLPNYSITTHLHDIESLNQYALLSTYDITKVSFHCYLLVSQMYSLLQVGSALGYGCGPVLVSKRKIYKNDLPHCLISVPGELTTANLLLKLFAPEAKNKKYISYDKIIPSIISDETDCGIIIHESRFLFNRYGLVQIKDLGQWWENTTHCPIPLGAIVIRKELKNIAVNFEKLLLESITMAQTHVDTIMPYISKNAQEMDRSILEKHIKTYVNDFSLNLGIKGQKAVSKLEEMAQQNGIIQ